jgi:sugar transferase (PEP-CTERM/EpsH1 system associated)
LIRVLHLAYAVSRGGAANVIVNVCNRLDPSRFRASIITLTPNGGFERLLARDRVELRRVLAGRGTDLSMVLRLARGFRELRPDVLHTHAWGTLCEGTLAARLAGVPVLVHNQHGTLEERPLQRGVQRWVWGWQDQVLAVSEILRKRMAERIGFPLESIRVIPNGVDASRFTPDASVRERVRHELGAGKRDVVVGAVGRFHPVKGHRYLIQALALLPSHVQLWLIGEGELRGELEKMTSSLCLTGRVRFLGHRDDIRELLASMDVFCQPSLGEGIPIALLEAMASRLPVVATATGGNVEVVVARETGLLVEPAKAEAIADGLRDLTARPEEAARLGLAGRRRSIERYAWPQVIKQYEDLYISLVDRRTRRGVSP